MTWLRLLPVRRATACVLAVGLALLGAEFLLPDLHDGDVSREELAALEVAEVTSLPHDHGAPSDTHHSPHVCHCIHAHVSGVAMERAVLSVTAVTGSHAFSVEPIFVGVDPEPRNPPPIA